VFQKRREAYVDGFLLYPKQRGPKDPSTEFGKSFGATRLHPHMNKTCFFLDKKTRVDERWRRNGGAKWIISAGKHM
jgi:hypothetical protein